MLVIVVVRDVDPSEGEGEHMHVIMSNARPTVSTAYLQCDSLWEAAHWVAFQLWVLACAWHLRWPTSSLDLWLGT